MVVFLDQGSFDIGKHLDNDYADGELDREATRKDFFIVRFEGDRLAERGLDEARQTLELLTRALR